MLLILIVLPVITWASELSDYYGVWTGAVVEGPVSGKEHDRYEVVIQLVPGKYTIEYPSLKCGGKLRLQGKKGRHIQFKDELEYGKELCAFGGYTQLLMIDTQNAAFQWFDNNGVLRAKGMLKRDSQTLAL
ncbi:hypothetical protein [Kaarinaea lacus]